MLTLLGPKEKINLNFYFHTISWDLKRFHEGFKITKKYENKNRNAQGGKGQPKSIRGP